MTKQIKASGDNTSSGVPAKNPRGAGRKRLAISGLYCDIAKLIIPSHSPLGRTKKKIVEQLSEPFLEQPSPFAQILIDGLAANIIMAKYFQAAFLRGNKVPTSILRDYTGLWNSISRDLATLQQMAKDGGAKDPVPSLNEYLEAIRTGQLVAVVAETDHEENPGQARAAVPVTPPEPKRTLF